jgi:hypothetical protein
MLRHASQINGYAIGASDGPIGAITDLLFDDVTWRVRWLVVDTSAFLIGPRVLLPPSALSHINHIGRQLSVQLTKQQVKNSPGVDTDEPVSRRMETNLYDYFGWSPYWSAGFYMGGYGYDGGVLPPAGLGFTPRAGQTEDALPADGDRHLRSIREVTGYRVEARDGDVGHVADFLLEDVDWSLHYLVIDTKTWWPGKKILISPRSIEATDWQTRTLTLDVDRQQVKDSPAYDGSQEVDRAYEYQFHGYYDGQRVSEPI